MHHAGSPVDDLGRGADEHAHGQHTALADDDALDHLGAGADETVILDYGWIGLQRLQHPADAHATRKVHALANLGAGADRSPGVDHRALVHIAADVHEAGHQHHVLPHIGALAHHGPRHGPEARRLEAVGVPAVELVTDLVPPGANAAAERESAVHHAIGVEAERQQHGLLEPLMHDPVAAGFLGDAGATAVEQLDGQLHGRAQRTGGLGAQGVARLPGGFDLRFQNGEVVRGHLGGLLDACGVQKGGQVGRHIVDMRLVFILAADQHGGHAQRAGVDQILGRVL